MFRRALRVSASRSGAHSAVKTPQIHIRWQHEESKAKSAYEYASHRSSTTPSEDIEIFKRSQQMKAVLLGTIALVTLVGGFQIYDHRNWFKAKLFGDNFDNETFDEMYEGLKQRKRKRNDSLLANAQNVTNPNDSNVPGVYICGNNHYGLVSGDVKNDNDVVPLFKRLDVFDGFVVRDIVLSEKSGALVNDKGDLYQWGQGFNGDSSKPSLKGFNLQKVQISNGVLYVLNSKGEVYYLPESMEVQEQKLGEISGWFGKKNAPYFRLNTPGFIKDISAGLEHLTLLDNNGQVFSCATGLPGNVLGHSYGQFGLPEYSQFDEPPKPNDVHEVVLLNKYKSDTGEILNREIEKIAAGEWCTLACDSFGSIWAWGSNKYGTVGKTLNFDTEIIPYPVKVEGLSSHFKRSELAKCSDLVVGGDTAFATVGVSDIYKLFEEKMRDPSRSISAHASEAVKYFSWGHGLKGSLGLGSQMFVHFSSNPKEVKAFNNLKEFNESTNRVEPIMVNKWTIGHRHGFVQLTNGDVLSWGDGTKGQLADGKKSRRGAPGYVPKLLEPKSSDEKTGSSSKWQSANNRLQLHTVDNLQQEVVAGWDTSAIVYKKL